MGTEMSPSGRARVLPADGDGGQVTLLGDIGGTTARLAFLVDGELTPVETRKVAQFDGIVHLLRSYIDHCPRRTSLKHAVLAAAGPSEQSAATVTNSGWRISSEDLRAEFGIEHVKVINDYAATALSLPRLEAADIVRVGGGESVEGAPRIVLGPGTGMGLSCLFGDADAPCVLDSEGGHATLSGISPREDAVIQHLRDRLGHVSAERVLSGPGIVNLYHSIAAIDGNIAPVLTAKQITAAALNQSCSLCRTSLNMFCALLGTFAGNAALTFGARGGVYIAGSIAAHISDFLVGSQFRRRFEAKGRFQPYLRSIPAYIVKHEHPAFPGLKAIALEA